MDEERRTTTCHRCDAPLRIIRPALRPHWGQLRCDSCQKFRGFVATPTEELGGYTMPFGKFKGRTLAEIATIDRGYLEWAARNMNSNSVRNACRRYLETT